ncbi:energy transducer TonB family protein [Bartonella sp. B10]
MNFANTRRLSTLWVGAFIGACFLHAALGAQFYFRNTGVGNNGMLAPVIMLTFAQEVVDPDMRTELLNSDTDLSYINTDQEALQSDFLEQKTKASESVDQVQPEDFQNTVEKDDFIVPKPLKKSLPSGIEHKEFVKKQVPQQKIIVKQLDTEVIPSSIVSHNGNAATLESALLAEWLEKVQAQLEKQKNYVVSQRTSHTKGTVQLEFRVHKKGNIFSSRVARSAGDQGLDRLAMAALQRVGTFPPPPQSQVDKIIRVSLIFS